METNRNSRIKDIFLDVVRNFAGCCIYAAGINCFTAPHKIAPGGASGIAILVNYVSGCPIGLFVFLFNVPFLVWIVSKRYFSKEFVIRTLLSTVLLSVITDYLVVHFPVYQGNPLLSSMFGGAMLGIGLGLVHLGRSNTGGISLLGLIIQKAKPQFHVGTMITVLNFLVVLISGVVFKNIESLLYASITVYLSGMFMDNLLENASAKELMIIISECTDKVQQVFLEKRKGITILKGEGGYTSEMQRVILCAVTKNDCGEIQKSVEAVDPQALVIVTEASKVSGKGFKHLM